MKIIDVAAGLVFRDHRLLIAQRYAGAHLGGLWELPGGKREPSETFEQALRRELLEELGIEVEVGELFDSITHDYPEKSVHLKFYRCLWQRHEPRALGCADFKWIQAGELDAHAFPAADARLIEKLKTTAALWE